MDLNAFKNEMYILLRGGYGVLHIDYTIGLWDNCCMEKGCLHFKQLMCIDSPGVQSGGGMNSL